jgi:hypothetical protein
MIYGQTKALGNLASSLEVWRLKRPSVVNFEKTLDASK